ncbi:MAG: hypothetical protein MPF33_09900 [Candidatus Aramenus sp.]|jgi:hypothetical protein|nr:hypothetical protein [Candidatus Aramenus sp.]
MGISAININIMTVYNYYPSLLHDIAASSFIVRIPPYHYDQHRHYEITKDWVGFITYASNIVKIAPTPAILLGIPETGITAPFLIAPSFADSENVVGYDFTIRLPNGSTKDVALEKIGDSLVGSPIFSATNCDNPTSCDKLALYGFVNNVEIIAQPTSINIGNIMTLAQPGVSILSYTSPPKEWTYAELKKFAVSQGINEQTFDDWVARIIFASELLEKLLEQGVENAYSIVSNLEITGNMITQGVEAVAKQVANAASQITTGIDDVVDFIERLF